MTDFEKTYQNYNPRQTALDEARALLTAAAKAAMADGALPEAELPTFIVVGRLQYIANSEYSSFTVWTTRVSNPV